MNVPIACAGVLVKHGDVIVGDSEGVVAIPAALVHEVAADAPEQERVEHYALERVRAGEPILDVYPLGPGHRADFEEWSRGRNARSPSE